MPHGLVAYGETEKGAYYVTVVTLERGESKTKADSLMERYERMGFGKVYYNIKNGKSLTVLALSENKKPGSEEIISMAVLARRQEFAPKIKMKYRGTSLESIADECLNLPWILHR